MRYVGGKTRIAKWVDEHVASLQNGHTTYLEPFVGSGATFVKMAPRFQTAVAADDHADLILMWKAIAAGWNPPEHVTKEEYVALRSAEPSALRGFVGFGASFSGKWFGGYVDTAWDEHWQRFTKPYLGAARASVLKARDVFGRAAIVRADYREHCPGHHTLVYCDPPYAGTLGYGGTSKFDSAEFWDVARRWSVLGATVIVSECVAPRSFVRGVRDIAWAEGVQVEIDEDRSWPISVVYIDLTGTADAVSVTERRMESWAAFDGEGLRARNRRAEAMTNEERARKWLRDTGHSQFKEHVESLTTLLDEVRAEAAAEERKKTVVNVAGDFNM